MPLRRPDRDEELGKRDDNYHRRDRNWKSAYRLDTSMGVSNHTRWRRPALLVVSVICILLFIYRDSSTSLQSHFSSSRLPTYHLPANAPPRPASSNTRNVGPAPSSDAKSRKGGQVSLSSEINHYYNGDIRFFELRASLDQVRKLGGSSDRNVLFAAASLQSISHLLPLACDMASRERNNVHFAVVGRAAMNISDILEINSINPKKCKVYFHDGRPDYSEYSTDTRAASAVTGALKHINNWIHPQVLIVDDPTVEDSYFGNAAKLKADSISLPIIELPAGTYSSFDWITRLDSASLGSWHKPSIEIVVHSPPKGSGALARLLKSLSAVSFNGLKTPKLTVELPSQVDSFVYDVLREFKWPSDSSSDVNLLKLQRRIVAKTWNAEQQSVRFIESSYPANTDDDYILTLSTNVEVAALFYHYLMFTILDTRYSKDSKSNKLDLAGISLFVPQTAPDGKTKLNLPEVKDGTTQFPSDMFLYEAPQAEALLVFGSTWVELHDYLTRRLDFMNSKKTSIKQQTNQYASAQPMWLEYLLELSRARSWLYLYPAKSNLGTFVTIHKDLYKPAEGTLPSKPTASKGLSDRTDDSSTQDSNPDLPLLASVLTEEPQLISSQPLSNLLPYDALIPSLTSLSVLSYTGQKIAHKDLRSASESYVQHLRKEVGGCTSSEAQKEKLKIKNKAGDIFCYPPLSQKGVEFEPVDTEIDMDLLDGYTRPVKSTFSGRDMGRDVDDEEVDDDDERGGDDSKR